MMCATQLRATLKETLMAWGKGSLVKKKTKGLVQEERGGETNYNFIPYLPPAGDVQPRCGKQDLSYA